MSGSGKAVETARAYYNSSDADAFYSTIWGGEDIHVGLYETPDESIRDASHRTVREMARRVEGLNAHARVLDLGSGYAGAARHLARTHGCEVVALNLSEVENERARRLNAEQGLADRVDVVDGPFEKIPYPDASFDVVWSQDAILHSADRARVLEEAARVLRPGGELVFTDPMQTDDCPTGVLGPVLDRIHLESLGSPAFYHDAATRAGLESVSFDARPDALTRHYTRVLEETTRREKELVERVSPEYVARMKNGLGHWIEGGRNGHLTWGILHFRKPHEGGDA